MSFHSVGAISLYIYLYGGYPAPFFPTQLIMYFYQVMGKQGHVSSQNLGIDDATNNVFLSGNGKTRACKFSKSRYR